MAAMNDITNRLDALRAQVDRIDLDAAEAELDAAEAKLADLSGRQLLGEVGAASVDAARSIRDACKDRLAGQRSARSILEQRIATTESELAAAMGAEDQAAAIEAARMARTILDRIEAMAVELDALLPRYYALAEFTHRAQLQNPPPYEEPGAPARRDARLMTLIEEHRTKRNQHQRLDAKTIMTMATESTHGIH